MSSVEMQPHPELHYLRKQLRDMLASMSKFAPTMPEPPIIDASFNPSGDSTKNAHPGDAVHGLRGLRDTAKRDLDVLEKFLSDPECARLPALSTNAPYLISVWKEVLCAPQPIVAISNTFSENGKPAQPRKRGLPKEAGVKVDVVANGGRRWVRVNTTKNSRMLAEFREIDSYLTDSEDESGDEGLPSLAQAEFDNSLLRMGRTLLSAAKENLVPGTAEVPAVTMRLTRLDPSPEDPKENDARIAITIDKLRHMGVDVQLGERDDNLLSSPPEDPVRHTRCIHPTRQINLDLSILIALVSDLTHAPLPSSLEDAQARFTPSSEYVEWKKKRLVAVRSGGEPPIEGDNAQFDVDYIVRPSRALVTQVLQEMSQGLLQDIFERLRAISNHGSDSPPDLSAAVEFWTTPEAKERCLQIVGKIGGPLEQLRAQAIFSDQLSAAEDDYWNGSRYAKGFIPLLPIRLLPTGLPDASSLPPPHTDNGQSVSPFFRALARTCRNLLRLETIPHPHSTPPPTDDRDPALNESDEIQRAAVTRANPRLTAHTVQSLLWGAVRGWTTLTANKTSLKAILKEMKSARNGALWDRSDMTPGDTDVSSGPLDGHETAAIWTVDPRSLAEGMRADFGTQ